MLTCKLRIKLKVRRKAIAKGKIPIIDREAFTRQIQEDMRRIDREESTEPGVRWQKLRNATMVFLRSM